ncbi:AAA family ATPase [Glycomyces luteolus]|uniref:AAA family ATPase n=1 Tax=Glycomyces luteolus TaxID=2670330 RepID=A0A9X3T4E8_9ACTN|nr:helix-turn-helix transcriptional regulator [Glycomyces luteolus]MDA1360985.1 AAA family ATPase [Glycomyces luteolus]
MLHGRQAEQAAIDRMLHGILDSRPGVLVMRGEAGIGKSALLDYAAENADAHVLRVTGVESEAALPFAALHSLLRPVLDRAEALPAQQAAALLGALGMGESGRGDRFLVGLATLNLFVELSSQRPLVCLVDDAQWMDGESADALLFAARRLHAEPIAVLFAARTGADLPATGLPELWLARLDDAAAGRLLAERSGTLPPALRDQLVAEAQGNPLALVELPRMLTAEQRTGALVPLSFTLGTAEPATDRVLAGFRDRIAALPDRTRSCLLVAALDDGGSLEVLTHAARLLGIALADAAPAERAGLIRITGDGVAFHHPLVRTAVLLACDITARIAAHRALADAVDDDRRPWHLAAVTMGADEQVAMGLERLAQRARQRGGQAAVSAAYARAAVLSPQPEDAARRYTAAAFSAAEAGLRQRATELVERAGRSTDTASLDPAVAAELAQVRARLAFEEGRPLEAARILLEIARTVAADLTRLSFLGLAAYYAWTSTAHPDQVELARRIEALTPKGGNDLTAGEAVIRDFRVTIEGGTSVTTSLPSPPKAMPSDLRFLVTMHTLVRADRDGMIADAEALIQDCRTEGRLGRIPQAMTTLAIAQALAGRHDAARTTAAEGLELAADMDQPVWRGYVAGVHAWLSAVAGDENAYAALSSEAMRSADSLAWMPSRCWAEYAGAMLDLGAGRYAAATERIDQAAGPSRHAFVWRYAWPDYVEAAVKAGEPHQATAVLERYAAWANSTGQVGTLAVLHRARAMMAGDDSAERLYERALALHLQHEQPFDLARTRLAYGEWLRRHRRRSEARLQLEAAKEGFDRLGAAPWSTRAAGELRAAGVSVPGRVADDPLAVLTPQELQVVRLAVTGATNRDIGAQLFLSPRTVAYHLYKAFPKLGITSRTELGSLATDR